MCMINPDSRQVRRSLPMGQLRITSFGTPREHGNGIPMHAVDQVFRENSAKVANLARRLLGNEADVEEVTQEIFLQVVRKLHTFRGESALSTWLYKLAIHAILNYREKLAQREFSGFGEIFENRVKPPFPEELLTDNPRSQILDQETQEMIEQAIAELPGKYQKVFVLADVDNLSNTEIGEILGLTLAAVKSRLHRARHLMRKALTPYFEECAL